MGESAEWQKLLHEGTLLKKSPSMFGGWQKRHVKLFNNGLAYYSDKGTGDSPESGLLGFLHVDGIESVEDAGGAITVRAFCQKRGPRRPYEFKSEHADPLDDWVKALRDLIASKGS